MKIFVTGGCGFIGSNLVRILIEKTDHKILNLDALTYAGNKHSLEDIAANDRYRFEQVNICNPSELKRCFEEFKPDCVMHLAAESHVDRSIDGPDVFMHTNIIGTYELLQVARRYHANLSGDARENFRFLHVSTDEVYGSLGEEGLFSETTAYDPRSPYSASKAASDHMARAWNHTYGLPVIVTNCSNNYGPWQFPEKLIPVVILKALRREAIPVYGQGENVRDWLHVEDHVGALLRVMECGRIGETYNIGGSNEMKNIDLVKLICSILDEIKPREDGKPYDSQIEFVTDRPGHDLRYAIDATKIASELQWKPAHDRSSGFRETVQWYLEHDDWIKKLSSQACEMKRLGNS